MGCGTSHLIIVFPSLTLHVPVQTARSLIYWSTPFRAVRSGSFATGDIAWFSEGTLNAAYNCVDCYAFASPSSLALIYETEEPSESRTVMYAELLPDVCGLVNVLKGVGVKRWDTLIVYLSMRRRVGRGQGQGQVVAWGDRERDMSVEDPLLIIYVSSSFARCPHFLSPPPSLPFAAVFRYPPFSRISSCRRSVFFSTAFQSFLSISTHPHLPPILHSNPNADMPSFPALLRASCTRRAGISSTQR